jgi:hypothetical protein
MQASACAMPRRSAGGSARLVRAEIQTLPVA